MLLPPRTGKEPALAKAGVGMGHRIKKCPQLNRKRFREPLKNPSCHSARSEAKSQNPDAA
jgi:hypothetical protein